MNNPSFEADRARAWMQYHKHVDQQQQQQQRNHRSPGPPPGYPPPPPHYAAPPPPAPPPQQASGWPDSLRRWLERSMDQSNDPLKDSALQLALKEEVQKAVATNAVWTKNWDAEPPFTLRPPGYAPPIMMPPTPAVSHAYYPSEPYAPLPQPDQHPSSASGAAPSYIPLETAKRPSSKRPLPSGGEERPPKSAKKKPHPSSQEGTSFSSSQHFTFSAPTRSLTPPSSALTPPLSDNGEDPTFDPARLERRAARFTEAGIASAAAITRNPGSGSSGSKYASFSSAKHGSRTTPELSLEELQNFVIQGTSTELERPYLRLTSEPDPASVRPERVLIQSLNLVDERLASEGAACYAWASEQLKSIRQDLVVQRIKSPTTVRAYETHARVDLAAAVGDAAPDFNEFNQCATQLNELYLEGFGTPQAFEEFKAYTILYHVYHKTIFRSTPSSVYLAHAEYPPWRADAEDGANQVVLALKVWEATALQDFSAYFRYAKQATKLNPKFSAFLGKSLTDRVREEALAALCRAVRPAVPFETVRGALGFAGLSEARAWCASWGAPVDAKGSGLDSKLAAQVLYDKMSNGDE